MRKIGLDVLRGLAIILVLFRHSDLSNNILKDFGWLGVDLFFVLSGFLISNLLFTEYRKNGEFEIKQFLIKRGFKIFPPFYFFIFITLLYHLFFKQDSTIEYQKLLSELLYLQSYISGIWLHTWTLAVEEHFYLLFSVILFFSTRKHLLEKKIIVIGTLISLMIVSLTLRFHISYPHRNDDFFGFTQTHLRSDGILIGILISYLLNFIKTTHLLLQRKWIPFCISIVLIAPGFYFKGGGFFMNTIGLTLTNIGFSILVLLVLDIDNFVRTSLPTLAKRGLNFLSFIGINSYSIYLWHLNSKSVTNLLFTFDPSLNTLIYITISIISGVIMSYLIEKPSIIIRNRFLQRNIKRTTNKHCKQ
ncbi:MAG: acyltransferase family protein [Ekhidna sp.]